MPWNKATYHISGAVVSGLPEVGLSRSNERESNVGLHPKTGDSPTLNFALPLLGLSWYVVPSIP